MEQTKYIAALDLGTSKMLAMAAKKEGEGVLNVLGFEKIASGDNICRGSIHNIDGTADEVRPLVNRLSRHLNPGIKKIYVGIGGQSLHTESYSVKKEINGIVTNETIDYLHNECKQYKPELVEILEIVSPEYYLDNVLTAHPKGVYCKEIEARFQLIIGRPSLKKRLKDIEAKAGIEIAGFFISPLATAEVALQNPDKELGCALVEFGAGVTYLSIYKDKLLRYLVTIPLGGNVITKDICALPVLEPQAEELKIKEGSALAEPGKDEKINEIIEARATEIVMNIIEQIKQSGYEPALGAGIIITGGGALLKNLDRLMAQKTGKPVRLASVEDHTQTCILGLLTLGKENCAKEIPKTTPAPPIQPPLFQPGDIPEVATSPIKKTPTRRWWKTLVEDTTTTLFGDDSNNSSNNS
jgi:cell division protein FtsA